MCVWIATDGRLLSGWGKKNYHKTNGTRNWVTEWWYVKVFCGFLVVARSSFHEARLIWLHCIWMHASTPAHPLALGMRIPKYLFNLSKIETLVRETRPSRPIRCDVWIVEWMRYRPTNRPTDTASYRGALSHLKMKRGYKENLEALN